MRQYFRFTGNYHFAGLDNYSLPIYKKKSNDIEMYYNHEASSWVIKNDIENMIFAISDRASPRFVDASDWNFKVDGEFKTAGSVFHFECVDEDQAEKDTTQIVFGLNKNYCFYLVASENFTRLKNNPKNRSEKKRPLVEPLVRVLISSRGRYKEMH